MRSWCVGFWLGILTVAGCTASGSATKREARPLLGGCRTSEHEYGLEAYTDTAAVAALEELIAPGTGPKAGAACRRLGVDAPFFVRLGAIDSVSAPRWATLARQVTTALGASGVHIAERSLLRHTVGPCFPPYHIDFRTCGPAGAVADVLEAWPNREWQGFVRAASRGERLVWISAGTSLQRIATVVELR